MFRQSFRITLLAGLVAAASTGLAVSAVHAEVLRTEVGYGDLDLRSVAGQKELARRISVAANQVCRHNLDEVSIAACREDSIGRASRTARGVIAKGL